MNALRVMRRITLPLIFIGIIIIELIWIIKVAFDATPPDVSYYKNQCFVDMGCLFAIAMIGMIIAFIVKYPTMKEERSPCK
jgi:hypothetical protein